MPVILFYFCCAHKNKIGFFHHCVLNHTGLDESHCTPGLRTAISNSLRLYDEAIVLPQAHRSSESGGFKNIAMRINANEPNLGAELFSPHWFTGTSAVVVNATVAEALLHDPHKRAAALQRLSKAIPSEMSGVEVTVGPVLEGDENDRDREGWVAGFDAPGSCVGLYSASARKSTDITKRGISREHLVYFLVAKAGGGLASQTFHSRLCSALKEGKSLADALAPGASPGAQALRRVSNAAKRNRARILVLAAEALGFHDLDTVGDNSSPLSMTQYRLAIPQVSVSTNVLRRLEEHGKHHLFHYSAGCVDAETSIGVISPSNPAEGFVAFVKADGSYKVQLRNDAFSTVPYASQRIVNNREMTIAVAEDMKSGRKHPDEAWILSRFVWKSKELPSGFDMLPPTLCGTHESETYSSTWLRELGLASCDAIRLRPEVVNIAATEIAKLRATARHVMG